MFLEQINFAIISSNQLRFNLTLVIIWLFKDNSLSTSIVIAILNTKPNIATGTIQPHSLKSNFYTFAFAYSIRLTELSKRALRPQKDQMSYARCNYANWQPSMEH